MDSGALDTHFSETARRRVFYQYPQGAAPLTGLLSLADDQMVDKPTFGWWEDRLPTYSTKTVSGPTAVGPWETAAGADVAEDADLAVGTQYRLYVSDNELFRARDIVWVQDIVRDGASEAAVQGKFIVDSKGTDTDDYLLIRPITQVTGIANDIAHNGSTTYYNVYMIGTAAPEGDGAGTGAYYEPVEIENYTQIFRTAFSFTRTALKAGLRFDKTGIYRDKAKKNSLRHMIAMEKAMLWGEKGTENVTVGTETVPERKMGGVRYFLELWEAGSTYGNSGASANSDDEKRIIKLSDGTVSREDFEGYLERIFRYGNDVSNEKLCLCGSGALMALNRMVDRNSLATRKLSSKEAYGMDVTRWDSPFGTIYFKTHPLLSQNAALRYDAFFLDVGNLKYTYLQDSDTTLLTNRQNNDDDLRKDEWLTECGLEVRFPESHMLVENLQNIIA